MSALRHPEHLRARHRTAGFTLLEVLIAMLILAIGVLGIAALQFKGMQFNQDALFRSQINFLAWDLIERMRMNKENANSYLADGTWTVSANAPASKCNGTEIMDVRSDLSCWREQVAGALPPGSTATITRQKNAYILFLEWVDRENRKHSVAFSFDV